MLAVSLIGGYKNNNNNNLFFLIFNLTYCRMITSIVWKDDNKLLQESNLTARQPSRVSITLYI